MNYDDIVKRYAELDDLKREITEEQQAIKAQLADLEFGTHTIAGLKVTVSRAPRRFNVDTAAAFLTDEQLKLCTVEQLDTSKVREQLPPTLLELAMDEGSGKTVVRIS